MIYPYKVKHNGIWYEVGKNVPNDEAKAEVKAETPTEEPKPTKTKGAKR